jgi:hypothetical protein
MRDTKLRKEKEIKAPGQLPISRVKNHFCTSHCVTNLLLSAHRYMKCRFDFGGYHVK